MTLVPSSHSKFILLGAILANVFSYGYCLSGSFFGDGYIHLPLDDASDETHLQIQFRTSKQDGLLFLAAGSTDYCAVELVDGMIRVHIDLGSGDTTLGSPPGIIFNDLQWHSLELQRSQGKIRLTVDNIYPEETNTPGGFFELNIDKGLFLGGVGSFTHDVFFGNYKDFRGCLQNVQFNSVDVFHAARQQVDSMNVYGVEWECSPEFGATSDQPISFLHNTSFISFPSLQTRQEARITFNIKTRADRALVVYNSGRSADSDLLAVEIVRGGLKLTVNKGNGQVEVISRHVINDGHWHQAEVVIDRMNARLTVDGNRKESRLNFGDNIFLDLHGKLFVGGVGVVARSFAVHQGLHTLRGPHAGAGSLVGCVQNFKVDGQLLGFREAVVSRGLRPECVWTFPCLNNPCIEGATCVEEGFYYYQCICSLGNCFKTGSTGHSPSSTPLSDIIHMQDVVVREGSRSIISTSIIDVLVDYADHGIRDSGVVFQMINPPAHGNITVEGQSNPEVIFSLLDMVAGRVMYYHDGSEEGSDSIGLEVGFSGVDEEELPEVFRHKYGFTLMVQVAPWNDKPLLVFPQNDTLILVENTKLEITHQVLSVIDSDDNPDRLEFTIQYQPGYDIGYFELDDVLGVRARITSFTQEDVNAGKIGFVHRGSRLQQLRIQVSDGKDVSDARVLKIHAVPLRLTMETNSRLVLARGASALILKENLSFVSNAKKQNFDVHYQVVDLPYYGNIQKQLYADNTWTTVSTFTQKHVDKSRIRYVHNGEERSTSDYFVFKVSALNVESEEFEFDIRIVETHAYLERNMVLNLDGVREGLITSNELKATSSIPQHAPADITFKVISTPREGHLYKLIHTPNKTRKRKIAFDSNFTQADVNSQNIMFKFQRTLYDPIDDNFEFQVLIPGYSSDVHIFRMRFTPATSDVRMINNGLYNVLEGESLRITREDLYMEMAGVEDFRFTILDSGPSHGVIQLVNPSTGLSINQNTSSFTTNDIRHQRVFYRHDDSENAEDMFRYMSTPILAESDSIVQELQQLSGNFEIKILLRNDNPPERVTNKVLSLVANHGRVITSDDLEFYDPDINFDSSDLKYIVHKASNGQFVQTNNQSVPVFEFTQRELVSGQISFIHNGALEGVVSFFVSDGSFDTSDELIVVASEPWIRIVNNTGLTVENGQVVALLPSNLSIESNIDMDARNIKILIKEPPMHGVIRKGGIEKGRFNFQDMKDGQIIYDHDGSDQLHDQFVFVVKVNELLAEGQVNVQVTSAGHLSHPHVGSNKGVSVNQLGVVVLTAEYLNISHPETPPSEIVYTIEIHPKHGILSLTGSKSKGRLERFTQEDINQGRLKYKNVDPNHDSDMFNFYVTNGLTSLQGLDIAIDIIPIVIPMETIGFAVKEGETHLIGEDVIRVQNKHFINQPLQFFIINQPSHGHIVDYDDDKVPISQFSHLMLQTFKVMYVHSGSDTTSDQFTVQARLPGERKSSNPGTVRIGIIPTNDEVPYIITNRKLDVWTGSTTPITQDYLCAKDNDTVDSKLVYHVTQPNNGIIALSDRPNDSISNFTQEMINEGRVVFVHRGAISSSFTFEVSDGVNRAEPMMFNILASPLNLQITTYEPLKVYPGILQPISPENLKVITNDKNQTRPIVFSLQTKPTNGKLVRNFNDSWEEVTTFWQEHIDHGEIAYQHTGARGGWLDTDSFEYDVNTAYAQSIEFETFSIEISFQNINKDNQAHLLDNRRGFVEEGGSIIISKDHLDNAKLRRSLTDSTLWSPEVNYVITKIPSYGALTLEGNNATEGMKFTQRDINKGNLAYTHDHSDSLWDTFEFVVEIETAGQTPDERKYRRTNFVNVFNISIDAINDQPFKLITTYPGIELVQGFSQLITETELQTLDPDTPPENITYEIQTQPNNGYLTTVDDKYVAIRSFTQQDINLNRIMFVQDGTTDSGAFYFKVSDGRYKPLYKVFNIRVHPLSLRLVNVSDVLVEQGRVNAFLTAENFGIETNGDWQRVWFNVTRPPSFGQLYMHDSPVHQFSLKDVDLSKVTYIQTNLSGVKDQFEFTLYDAQNILERNLINIRVKSMVKLASEFVVKPGQQVTITLDALDASRLAFITKSIPVYWIMRKPSGGTLHVTPPSQKTRLRHRRQSRPRPRNRSWGRRPDEVPIRLIDPALLPHNSSLNFTHKDVMDGLVRFEASPNLEEFYLQDSFAFVVTAKNSQPTEGTFPILITSQNLSASPTLKPGPLPPMRPSTTDRYDFEEPKTPPPPGSQGTQGKLTTDINMDHLMIVCSVCAITLVVIVVLIIIKCLKRQRKKEALRYNTESMKEDSKTPLAGPQVHAGLSYDELSSKSPERPIPVINVTSDSDVGSIASSQSTATRSASSRPPVGHIHRRDMPTPPKSPDVTKTEFSRTVPTCKVTPLLDEEGESRSPPPSAKHDQVTFDWENIDPELLQHCRTTNPVLHANKYWV